MAESDALSPTVVQRAAALRKAIDEVKKLRANRQIRDALNTRNGPKVDAVHDLLLNSPVLVQREENTGQTGHQSGPYNLVALDNKSCVVDLPYSYTTFRSTSVKPYLVLEGNTEEIELDSRAKEAALRPVLQTASRTGQTTPRTVFQNTSRPKPVFQPPATQPVKQGRRRLRKYPLLDITVFL